MIEQTERFWKILCKLYKIEDGYEGTVTEISSICNIKLLDGFFHSQVLETLMKESILTPTGEKRRIYYRSKQSNVYKINRNKLDKFIIRNWWVARMFYMKWVKGSIDLDIV